MAGRIILLEVDPFDEFFKSINETTPRESEYEIIETHYGIEAVSDSKKPCNLEEL